MIDPSFWRTKRVLVTGHTGFKGAWLCTWLAELGVEVTGYALPPSTHPSLYERIGLDRRVRSILADVRDRARVQAAVDEARPDIVLHLAAQALVNVGYREPVETFATNVMGTAHVLEACRNSAPTRAVVVVTSDKCYEPAPRGRAHAETDPMGGHDPYSASKGCTEILASSWRRSFFARADKGLATARAGNVIGGGDFTHGRLVPDCLDAFAAGRPVALRHPDGVRPWQHVLEPLSGYLQLAQRLFDEPAAWSGAWNFGPDDADALPARSVAEQCARAFGQSPSPAWVQEPGEHPHETAVLRLDSTLARAKLGWRPAWNLSDALEHIVAWHTTHLADGDVLALMRAQLAAHEAVHA